MTTNRRVATTIYNPHLLERGDLIATFVARRPLLDELLEDLRRGGGQHHLLVGARGSGKTTLLLRTAYGIEDDAKLSRTCVALRFPEEQYNVSCLADFWINCIDALTDTLEQRGHHEAAATLDAEVKALESLEDQTRASQALALLTGWAKRTKRLLVLLVDNMDIVLERLRDAHWPLREVLSADNRLVVIGASATPLQESLVYESPFYDFFNVHELGPLSEDEARKLVVELARLANASEVESIVTSDPGRFKALYVLTGGMPRTLALLHGILAAGKSARVEEDLEGLLDHLTPYYKARFDDLPSQSQLIVDAVAQHWHPMTAADCANSTRIGVNVVSAQLDRLSKQGLLSKVALPSGSKLGFQVAERFFNIWYLMRASRRLRRRLGWFVEFLRVFYGEDELKNRAEEILATPAGRKSIQGGAAKMLAFATAVAEPGLRRRLEMRATQALVEECNRSGQLREMLDLDGEDAHLAPVLDRVKAMRDLRACIHKSQLVWPKGITPAGFAEMLACDPLLEMAEKQRYAEAVMKGVGKHSRLLKSVAAHYMGNGRSDLGLGSKFLAAVGSGQIPSMPDLATSDDVDNYVAMAQDPEKLLLVAITYSDAVRKLPTPDAVIYRVLRVSKTLGPKLIVAASDNVRDGKWPMARRRVLQIVEGMDQSILDQMMVAGLLEFSKACVQSGLASEAVDLLREAHLEERLLPLYEALRAASSGPNTSLAHLAPEVRAPAEEMLKILLEPATPKSPSEKDKPKENRGPTS